MGTAVATTKRFPGASNRLKDVRPSDKMLAVYDKDAENTVKYHANYRGITAEAFLKLVDAHVKKLVDESGLWMRVRSTAFEKILEEGRFKSQFETGNSCGSYHPDGRARFELAMFSYPEDMEPTKRPVYGYMTNSPDGELGGSRDSVGMYGQIAVKFKRDVVARKATFTFDDSLGKASLGGYMELVAMPVAAPDHRAVEASYLNTVLSYTSVQQVRSYPEVQYHKGLRVKHIEEVVFMERKYATKAITDKLDAASIPYRFHNC